MMATYSTQAVKTLERMDASTKQRIREGVSKIPAGDIVKLQGHTNLYRLRVGNWRVVFSYVEADKVLVEKIAPRGQVYKGV
jgi:mRNA interferase RelE/StbE